MLFFVSRAHAIKTDCPALLKLIEEYRFRQDPTEELKFIVDENKLHIMHLTSNAHLVAVLEDDGALSFSIWNRETRDGVSEVMHPALEPAKLFEMMLGHFGDRVQYLKGNWIAGSNLDTNLNKFNLWTGPPHNLSLEEAAKKTWTARMAAKYGFTQVLVARHSLEGTPGHYKKVELEFRKPETENQQ